MSDFVLKNLESISDEYLNKSSEQKDKKIIFVKVIVIILISLLFVEGILYFFVMPCFSNPIITIKGNKLVSSTELVEKLNFMKDDSWTKFDTSKAVSTLSNISCIESVSVEKKFPDRVFINITERIPVAKTLVSVDNRTVPIQIDKNGVLFSTKLHRLSSDNAEPLVSGLPVETMKEGMRLPIKYRELMNQIAKIKSSSKQYFEAISEIQVVSKDYGNYELVIYPIHSRVKVLTDRSLDEEVLKYMMIVLDVVNSMESNVSEVDLRYGSVSYKTY